MWYYVAGTSSEHYFQPITKSDVDKMSEFSLFCKGYETYPPLKEGESRAPAVVYPTPVMGVYKYDSPRLRAITTTDLIETQISKECPEIFGHGHVAGPAVLSLEAAQKACVKKYHEGGTLDYNVICQAKDWVEAMYRPYIKDCYCGSIDDGVTGASHYGSLVGLDMSTSAGLPWKALNPNGKGKRWLFDENDEMIPMLKAGVAEVRSSWEKGYAFPSVFTGTLKDEKRPIDRVILKKTRIFTAGPVEKSIADRMLFADFIVQFKQSRLNLMHCYGINAESLEWNEMAYMHKNMGTLHGAADYSGYDASLTAQLIAHAYELVARFYPEGKDKVMIDCSSVECRNHFVYMYGGLWHCAQGNPSGCVMTTVINSVINHLLLSYAWIKHFRARGDLEMVDYTHWRKHFICHVYGDDFIYTVSERAKTFTCKAYAAALIETGQELTSPDKSDHIPDFFHWSQLSLLKRSFIVNPFLGNKNLYVGPVDKEVIEEIPRWMHKDSDDESLQSTIMATLRLAALWGRTYFDFIVSELRKCETGNALMAKICAEEIFQDVCSPYVSAVSKPSIDVIAFYMADENTLEQHRFLSNLSVEHRFKWTIEGKTMYVSCAEQAYALEKAMFFNKREEFRELLNVGNSAGRCARICHSIKGDQKLIIGWNAIRLEVMERILREKFSVPQYAQRLFETGASVLAEASSHDLFWGSGRTVLETRQSVRYPGGNHLGRLLMKIRAGL